MLEYLEKTYGERATKGDKQKIAFLKDEVKRLEAAIESQKEKTAGTTDDEKREPIGSENETDSDVSFYFHQKN